MNVLLINPPAGSLYHRVGLRFLPLGLAYIGAVLKKHHHAVRIVDFEVENINHHTFPYRDYDVVGIGSDTTRWPAAAKIALAAKAAGATVVMGGPHVSFLDEEALASGGVDYVVRSEGEYTMLDLVEHLSQGAGGEDVPGVSYLADGQFVRNPPRPFIEDLDAIPFPARELFDLRRYNSTLQRRPLANVLSSRGCPFNCEFCSCSAFSGLRWRTRSAENILDELEYLYRRLGYRAVAFFDDNFTLDTKRVLAVCDGILTRGLKMKWWAFSRTDTALAGPAAVRLMARAGLSQAFVGFETASEDTLEAAGKKATVEESIEATQLFKESHINIWGAFMLGFVDETEKMIRNTIRFAKKLDPYIAQFSLVTPYPGTRLFEKVKNRLITHDWRRFWGGEPTFRLDNIAPERLKFLFRKAYYEFYSRPSQLGTWMPYLVRAAWRYYTERKGELKRFMVVGSGA